MAVSGEGSKPLRTLEDLARLQELLGYRFCDSRLLMQALVHSSAREDGFECNERFEFLGDSILGMLISESIFHELPRMNEGDLSAIKSVVVSSSSLCEAARRLGLDCYIVMGRGWNDRGQLPDSVMANTFEAIVAAIYLDGGLGPARAFILETLSEKVEEVLQNKHVKNYKSILQQHTQRLYAELPAYKVVSEHGPDHAKSFEVVVEVAGKTYGPASGRTKKEAEQRAARASLLALGEIREKD